jgi:hypothetical protein
MGLLDSATNNIVLDAVLTDQGRQFLARNDGSFSIVKFALGDDEVDYSVISKYGRTVGKEKIEKNTPVLEALTNQSYALKYKLVSVSNPNLIRLPTFSLSGDSNVDTTSSTVTLGRNLQKTSTLLVEQKITNETTIDVELRDQTFVVEMNNMFLQIQRQSPDNVDGNQKAIYILPRSAAENSANGSRLQFTIAVKSLTDAQFTVFGSTSNKNIITSFIRVSGMQSGAVVEFKCNVNKNL